MIKALMLVYIFLFIGLSWAIFYLQKEIAKLKIKQDLLENKLIYYSESLRVSNVIKSSLSLGE